MTLRYAPFAFALLLLGCEQAPEQPDVVGTWVQENSGGREWIELQPGGAAVAYSRSERPETGEAVSLQWYWVDSTLVLRGNGGLSQHVLVAGDRMTMEDGTVLVRRPAP